ncbi:hypothetical protein LB542_23580 [Mesorhizobium sp. BR1-1-9]|uniref:hypothetical protein n=1 Tax=unclassified Mesorhizobium TaxID=325217 RepID=UPI0015E3E166|nr:MULTISPECIES: hypothetical protein [unclassified Mesorhizobium]MBZ9810062.1 hypothetical protein [Mesorhizobium sp. ESP-6-2]MBZ9873821.1 hypothetical protein [Mesorhizobium sp. BR1-1-9]MBZ9944272.1 hypothetical protein [Mesorhizobium sp. BR1-1-13]
MFFKLPKGPMAPPQRVSTDQPPIPRQDVEHPFYLYFHTEDGPMFDPYRIPGSRSLHIHRLPTWALLIGETYSSAVHAEVRRRPHRGMLPDVDFSRAVPDPSRPSLVRRIIRAIRPGAKIRLVDTAPSGSTKEPVGEKPANPYIARSRADGPDDSGPSALGALRSEDFVRSRAA